MYKNLITTTELEARLGDKNWIIFDCRFDLVDTEKGRKSYQQSHIPGAFYAHIDEQLSSPISPQSGRHPLPDWEKLLSWLGASGFDGHQQVVVYDDSGGIMAVRLWWLLKVLGHEQVAVLDGGWQAWQQENLAISAEPPETMPSSYTATFDEGSIVSTEILLADLDQGKLQIVDVRTAERYRGESEPIDPVAGHIPGAINIPLTENLDENGFFKPAAQLQQLYQPLTDSHPPSQLVCMCGSGVTACHSIFAMTIAGFDMPRLYAGSWSEWIRDEKRPVAIGPRP